MKENKKLQMSDSKKNIRTSFFIDIRNKEKREKFVNEILDFEGMSLINNGADSFNSAKEAVIKSIYPIFIDFKELTLDYLKNNTSAASAITNKSSFITPKEAIEKVKKRLKEWEKYKKEVIICLTTRVYRYEEEDAKKMVEDCEVELFADFFLKGDTPFECAAVFGYSCG